MTSIFVLPLVSHVEFAPTG